MQFNSDFTFVDLASYCATTPPAHNDQLPETSPVPQTPQTPNIPEPQTPFLHPGMCSPLDLYSPPGHNEEFQKIFDELYAMNDSHDVSSDVRKDLSVRSAYSETGLEDNPLSLEDWSYRDRESPMSIQVCNTNCPSTSSYSSNPSPHFIIASPCTPTISSSQGFQVQEIEACTQRHSPDTPPLTSLPRHVQADSSSGITGSLLRHQPFSSDESFEIADPELVEVNNAAKRENSVTPLTRYILKQKSLLNLHKKGFLANQPETPKSKPKLTEEEEANAFQRRVRNKKAAAKLRKKRKRKQEEHEEELERLLHHNKQLKQQILILTQEKEIMVREHLQRGVPPETIQKIISS